MANVSIRAGESPGYDDVSEQATRAVDGAPSEEAYVRENLFFIVQIMMRAAGIRQFVGRINRYEYFRAGVALHRRDMHDRGAKITEILDAIESSVSHDWFAQPDYYLAMCRELSVRVERAVGTS